VRLLPTFLLLVSLLSAGSALAVEEPASDKKPGFLNRMLHPFRKTAPVERGNSNRGSWRQLELTMMLEPTPLKVPETRQLKVTMTLVNKSKRFVQLEFPSTQRIEVVIKTLNGKLVEQWSEDHAFTNDPGVVSINPGERLVYTAMVATRDLKAGETYSVEGFFPNYEGLRVQKSLQPQK
jgi:hypothetical protein